jgi:hypothetical protein
MYAKYFVYTFYSNSVEIHLDAKKFTEENQEKVRDTLPSEVIDLFKFEANNRSDALGRAFRYLAEQDTPPKNHNKKYLR